MYLIGGILHIFEQFKIGRIAIQIERQKNLLLFRAIWNNNFEAVQDYLAKGADPHAFNDDGATPLMLAVIKRNAEISKVLLSKGANPNLKSKYEGETALDLATKKNTLRKTRVQISLFL